IENRTQDANNKVFKPCSGRLIEIDKFNIKAASRRYRLHPSSHDMRRRFTYPQPIITVMIGRIAAIHPHPTQRNKSTPASPIRKRPVASPSSLNYCLLPARACSPCHRLYSATPPQAGNSSNQHRTAVDSLSSLDYSLPTACAANNRVEILPCY
ncbi:MAG: hypothetical protein LBJ58_03365, partial [Tannerellaceae bacterium]|nr:hypothetical protein [Tannerellaceae bacterium]